MNSPNKGFTLIELLVVIAIIGILSSVVLASLNTARGKGADAAIKSDLNGIRAQAEIYRDSNSNNYTLTSNTKDVAGTCPTAITATPSSVFEDTSVWNGLKHALQQSGGDIAAANTAKCYSSYDNRSYVAAVPLKTSSGSLWCVDSNGISKSVAAVTGAPTSATVGGCQ